MTTKEEIDKLYEQIRALEETAFRKTQTDAVLDVQWEQVASHLYCAVLACQRLSTEHDKAQKRKK